jgi:pectin methylesterase-like acyl-CoA thioesterase
MSLFFKKAVPSMVIQFALLTTAFRSKSSFRCSFVTGSRDRSRSIGMCCLGRKTLSGLLACIGLMVALSGHARAQTVFPSSISTVAGVGAVGANPAKGAVCAPGSPFTAADALGDGCPAAQAFLGSSLYGEGADPFGNIFFLDTTNEVVHKIDARSGIMTLVAGGASPAGCTAQADKYGDNCLAATQTGAFNNPRGLTVDPYGNVLIAGYSEDLINIVCNAVSPLCPAAKVGYMEIVAGGVTSTTGSGSGVAGTTAGSAGDGNLAVSTTATTGIDQPRGAAADIYGNVYIADTANIRFRVVLGPASYNGMINPLTAAIALDSTYSTPVAGDIYPIMGGFSAVTAGNFCNGSSGAKSLDAYGDGCPFYNTAMSTSTSSVYGVAIDPSGDAVMSDAGNKLLRVLYMGGAKMGALITLENPGVTPVVGSIYTIAGGGTHGISTTSLLATTQIWNSSITRVAMDVAGNIFVGDSAPEVEFLDINTGFGRILFAPGTVCSAKTDSIGDGCPASQAMFGANSSTLSISIDNLGNLFLADSSDNRIRKVSASSLMPMAVGTPATQNIVVHEPAGVTGVTAALTTASSDLTLGTVSCATANGDGTLDCTIPATLSASAPGFRSTALTVTASGSSTATAVFPMSGLATGSALVTDGVTSSTAGSLVPTVSLGSSKPLSVAVDGSNNVYSADSATSKFSVYLAGQGATLLSSTAPTGLSQIAVDTQGDIYAVGSGSTSISKLTVIGAQASSSTPSSYSAGTVSYTPTTPSAKPQGIAVDGNGNVYVSDGTNGAIYKIDQTSSLQPVVTVASGFTNPTLLAVDNFSNVYVYDAGTTSIYKIAYPATQTTFLSSVTATGLAVDAAGDVYVQTATGVNEYPASGPVTTITSGGTTPNGIALDGRGNLYVSDAGVSGITEVTRNAVAYSFGSGSNGSPVLTGTMTNVGNQPATGSNAVTNTTNFSVVGTGTNACPFTSSVLGAQAIGDACTLSATFVGNGSGSVSDVLSYLPASTTGSLTLSGTLTGTAIATTTTISGQAPASPNYTPTGTEVGFTVTVTPASGATAPGGTVAVTVDSTTTYSTLIATGTSGVAMVNLSGLTAGSHTISAIYATSGTFTGSNSGTAQTFSIAQDTTTASWTPATNTVAYSSPIGTSALNATATFGGVAVPGVYMYTANGNEVNAATYLAIGNYTLGVTFTPTDSVDYTSTTATGGTFNVTKASTTAAVGATQNLVAADGAGNFTSVQTALNSLPATGGNLYIKPGTYNGFVSVVLPNVSMYGLGGVPGNVIITNENGAFSAPFPAGTGPGNNGSSGDQGSSTMVVARGAITGVNGGATFTPYNFYAENFTVANTYDTDNTNSNTNQEISGSCVGGQPGLSNFTLFNGAGTPASPGLCNSQALAFWITGDQAVLNNIYSTSLQDTIYAGSISASISAAARQYWFRGKITGNVDYIFGDAAAVFDHTSIYTVWHGNSATGENTIEAQNQADQTSGSNSYLSGYIMNSAVFTSQSTGMTNLFFGRPYGVYSTWVLLNSHIDQVTPAGYTPFNPPPLTNATYVEYNDIPYTDPTTGSPDLNGVTYLGAGGNAGTGVTGTREIISNNPGTPEASSGGFQISNPTLANTTLSQIEAQQYYPMAFLGTTVPVNPYNNGVTNWNPTTAIAAGVNAFVPAGTSATVAPGSSVTILLRPQTPGQGAVANGMYTIPTGTYMLTDTFNGTTSTLAAGILDTSASAYFTSSSLGAGQHSLSWTYSGDTNFSGSTTGTPYILTVTPITTTTTLAALSSPTAVSGSTVTLSATVIPAVTGETVNFLNGLTILGTGTTNASGIATYALTAGAVVSAYTLSASFAATGNYAASASASQTLTVTAVATTTTLAALSSSSAVSGSTVTLSATVTPEVAGETVTFLNGSATLGTGTTNASGVATYTLTAGSTGTTYALSASFAAAGNYGTSSSTSQTLTVTAITTTTTLAPLASSTAVSGSAVILSATVTPATAGETVTFLSGSATLGTGITNAAGLATYTLTTGNAGTSYTLSASFAATGNYGASVSTAQTLTVSAIPTTTRLGLSTSTSYPGGTVTLTATLTPAVSGATITFLSGSTTLGTGTTNASGVATYTLTAGATGTTYTLSASFAAAGNYAPSASSFQTLTVASSPTTIASSVTSISIVPGSSGTVTLTIAPVGGFTGTVALTCNSPVSYITCSMNPTSATLSGTASATVIGTISVASTTASIEQSRNGIMLAMLAPFGLLGLALRARKRRGRMQRIALILLFAACGVVAGSALSGCVNSRNGATIPSGSQVVSFTATAKGVSQTTQVTVNIN